MLLIALFILFPALLVYLCGRFSVLDKIGAVLLCYLAGIIVGNTGMLPEGFAAVQSTMTDVTIALALPLLLFSLDVGKWRRVAGKGILCMALATISIVAVTFCLSLLFRKDDPEAWKLAGLSMGVYTGGTPNLAAIKAALGVKNETYILFHTYDAVISFLYIVFMSTIAKPLFLKFLPAFKGDGASQGDVDVDESIGSYKGIFRPRTLAGLGLALLLSGAIVGIALLVAGLCPPGASTAVTILTITTLGIAASFVKPIRRLEKTFQAGMYIIYVFSFVVASMTRLDSLAHVDWDILGFVSLSIAASLALHALLCRVARIDADTFIITSVSAICSPPFVPVVAAGIRNSAVIVSGLTTGIIGYAIGNYLGITMAYLFKGLF